MGRLADLEVAGQDAFVHAVDGDAAAARREADRQGAFGQPVAGQERAGVVAGRREGLGEGAHHVRPDHVAADAGHLDARQVQRLDRVRAGAAGADVVAEGGAVGDRVAVGTDDRQPGQRPAGEILGGQEIGGHLAGQRGQEGADQTHVVIERQPRRAAVVVLQLDAVFAHAVAVGQQRAVGDHHPVGKARAAGRILQIGDIVGGGQAQGAPAQRQLAEILRRADEGQVQLTVGLAHQVDHVRRRDHGAGLAALHLQGQLADVAVAAAERGRQRQRYRQHGSILAAQEEADEVRAGLRDQR